MAKSPSNPLRGEYTRADIPGGFVRGRYAKRRIEVSVGESVRIIRGLQGLSQSELAKVTRIPRTSISAIENDRMLLGIERANVLARALKCHPAALVPPDRDVTESGAKRAGVALAEKRRRQTLVALSKSTSADWLLTARSRRGLSRWPPGRSPSPAQGDATDRTTSRWMSLAHFFDRARPPAEARRAVT